MAKSRRRSNYANKTNSAEYFFKEPLNPCQERLIELIAENDITICAGAPGSGKTFLALQEGIKLYKEKKIDKIYYVRNAIDYKALGSMGTGFTSGDFTVSEKARPLLFPILDSLYQLVDKNKADVILNKQVIEPLILDHIQGRTFTYSYVIVDEAENIPTIGMRMILTRLGKASKIVVLGDPDQKCTRDSIDDGLKDSLSRLQFIDSIGIMKFSSSHGEARHELIPEISRAYEKR